MKEDKNLKTLVELGLLVPVKHMTAGEVLKKVRRKLKRREKEK